MTGRERWLAVLRRQKPDRVPMDYWATPEADARLVRHLRCADLNEAMTRLHVDRPFRLLGRYVGPPLSEGTDMYGIRYRRTEHDGGVYEEPVHHPLAAYQTVEEIEVGYHWPSPDWFDYAHIRREVEEHPNEIMRGGGSEPFLLYGMLRGLEQSYIDLLENPAMVHYCLGRLFDLAYANTLRIYEQAGAGNVHITYVAEDMGSQQGLLFSPRQIEEFLLPGMKRMIQLAHEMDAWVFHHSDGAIRPVLPMMIAAGIDVLNPIQWRCPGMEREGLKRDFGERLIFHGGVDNQQTLPFGSVEDVRREVRDNLRILGAGGGYILAPCHNIQVVTPPENVVAMYETGYAEGAY